MQLNQCLTGNLEIIGDCLSFVYNLVTSKFNERHNNDQRQTK